MPEDINVINRRLIEFYGKDVSTSLPRFRIVWSSSQYEKRINSMGFDIYSESGIFLRTEFGTHEVEKYQNNPDMWVLEQLVLAVGQEMLTENYSYEPRWFFGASGSSPNPVWRAVKLLVDTIIFCREKREIINSSSADELERQRLAKEKELFKDMIQDESPYLPGAIKAGYAIVVPENYKRENKE